MKTFVASAVALGAFAAVANGAVLLGSTAYTFHFLYPNDVQYGHATIGFDIGVQTSLWAQISSPSYPDPPSFTGLEFTISVSGANAPLPGSDTAVVLDLLTNETQEYLYVGWSTSLGSYDGLGKAEGIGPSGSGWGLSMEGATIEFLKVRIAGNNGPSVRWEFWGTPAPAPGTLASLLGAFALVARRRR